MFEKTEIHINDTTYYLIKDYKENEPLRESLNQLAQITYGFNFREWYQKGFWQEKYIPYSIIKEDKVIANVSVNLMSLQIDGKSINAIQLGTVMTEESYRNQGLIRLLINTIINEYENDTEFIYLFANDSVLNFYPKFGFEKAPEYAHMKTFKKIDEQSHEYVKLSMDNSTDTDLLLRLINHSCPQAKVNMMNNPGLTMFYCISFQKDNIYYIKEMDTVVIAEYAEDTLIIQNIFSEKQVNLDCVFHTLMTQKQMKIELGFTPLEEGSYLMAPLNEYDTTLFIRGNNIFGNARFPALSHA